MTVKPIITKDSATIFLDGQNKTYFENSAEGREVMKAHLTMMGMEDTITEILSVWGNAPTVVPSLSDLKTDKRAEIATARYEREIAGVEVNGVLIDTGRDSQALITGAALAAMLDENYSLNWKTTAGFIHLTAPEIIAVAQAVRAHVQACFDREGELAALVDAAKTAEDLDAIIISWSV